MPRTLNDAIVEGEHSDEDAQYAPEKFADDRGTPVRTWLDFEAARDEWPENFAA